ncbi:bifunctional hydroxymethylpyrimidine kinase/phosphomethylpyrimidine kinase [Stappia sp.]|uniref:bifunctional hydroxymethylpyrimidine kinase/phosphomethylpyrimidine kinase n=1 Tax=Stappia sp. TaxID=1870903 RepID=UPI0032D959F3
MIAKSGHALLDEDAIAAVRERLVPLATLITPNLPEAAVLLERDDDWTAGAMHAALPDPLALGPEWVLPAGGHLEDSADSADLLYGPGGTVTLAAPRIATRNDHGTGC